MSEAPYERRLITRVEYVLPLPAPVNDIKNAFTNAEHEARELNQCPDIVKMRHTSSETIVYFEVM